jgi:thioredoxin
METFNEIINSDKPVLVDFYATWCGPCKVMGPVIEELGKELEGKARVLKVDVEKNQAVAGQYNVQAVPTLIIFKDGQIVWRNAGTMPKPALLAQIEQYMS